jgi:hypothetical protein
MFIVALVIAIITSIPLVHSVVNYYVTIHSSGTITLPNNNNPSTYLSTLPIHTDGRDIEYPNGTKMVLRGVWVGMFADSCIGVWGQSANVYDEKALNATLAFYKSQGVNVFNTFIWGDWWRLNMHATLYGGDGQTDMAYQDCLIRTAQVCQAWGMYFQIRLYDVNRTQGNADVGNPFMPVDYNAYLADPTVGSYWNSITETHAQSVRAFTDFWLDVSAKFSNNSAVIYCLIDEPTYLSSELYPAYNSTITEIRATGDNNLIVLHYQYAGEIAWVGDYVTTGYNIANVVFSEHVYFDGGTIQWKSSGYDPSIENIRAVFNSSLPEPIGTMTNYTQYTYNVPVWVSAIGCYQGTTNDLYYVSFRNTLEVLNEMGIGYCVFSATRTSGNWAVLSDQTTTFPNTATPNRVGQALFDAIAGIYPPPTYQMIMSSNVDPLLYQLNGTTLQSPQNSLAFAGTYNISVPNSIVSYTHRVLIGNIQGAGGVGEGYYPYVYSASPCRINTTVTVSSAYVYAAKSGYLEVALYNVEYFPQPNYYRATTLVVANNTSTHVNVGWNLITFTPTQLLPGNYCISVHPESNMMLVSGGPIDWAGMNFPWNGTSNTFDSDVAGISDTCGGSVAVYIPTAPLIQETLYFDHWENGSTNPVRIITLASDSTITATYRNFP